MMGTPISILGMATAQASADGALADEMLCPERRAPSVGAINVQSRMVTHALRQCLSNHARPGATEIGLCLGTAHGVNATVRRTLNTVRDQGFLHVPASLYATGLPNSTTGVVAGLEQLLGPNLTFLGYLSGLESLIMACRLIRWGQAASMIAGGFDTPSPDMASPEMASPAPAQTKRATLSGAGLVLLSKANGSDNGAPKVVGWASDEKPEAASESQLVDSALAHAGRDRADLVDTIALAPDAQTPDYLAATFPIRLINFIRKTQAPGLHAFTAQKAGEKAICVLVDIDKPESDTRQGLQA